MQYRRFLPYNLASVIIWATVYGAIGYAFGEYWDDLLAVARSVGFGLVALVVLSLVFYVYRRRRARSAAKANQDKPKND
jgi:membrane protein DedA with SNARE-associated domain